MAFDYAVLFTVPAFVIYNVLPDEKEKTAAMLEKRADVVRAKKQEASIIKLIKDSTEQKPGVVDELMKKGLKN